MLLFCLMLWKKAKPYIIKFNNYGTSGVLNTYTYISILFTNSKVYYMQFKHLCFKYRLDLENRKENTLVVY